MNAKIEKIVNEAIEELNSQIDVPVEYDKELKLIGKGAVIDSMSFVTLITTIEELIEDEMDIDIEIVSDRAFSQEHSPFRTIETLENYIVELVNENA